MVEWEDREAAVEAYFGIDEVDKRFKEGKNIEQIWEEFKSDLISDWKYAKEGGMDLHDFITEWADNNTEIYTTEVFKWYSRRPDRYIYADDAVEEYGHGDSIVKDLQMGIYLCLYRVASEILQDYEKYAVPSNEDENEEEDQLEEEDSNKEEEDE